MGAGQLVLAAASKLFVVSFGVGVILAALASHWLWAGIVVYIVATALWLYMLSFIELKFAYPIAASSIFFAAFFQSLLEGVFPSLIYWAGLLLVLSGIAVMTYRW